MLKAFYLLGLLGQAQKEMVRGSHQPMHQGTLLGTLFGTLFRSWKRVLQAEMLQGHA